MNDERCDLEKTFGQATINYLCLRWKETKEEDFNTIQGLSAWNRTECWLQGGWFWRTDAASIELMFLVDLLITLRNLPDATSLEARAAAISWLREGK